MPQKMVKVGDKIMSDFERYKINITNPNTDSTIKTQVDLEFPANTFATPEFNKYAIEINNNTDYTTTIAVELNGVLTEPETPELVTETVRTNFNLKFSIANELNRTSLIYPTKATETQNNLLHVKSNVEKVFDKIQEIEILVNEHNSKIIPLYSNIQNLSKLILVSAVKLLEIADVSFSPPFLTPETIFVSLAIKTNRENNYIIDLAPYLLANHSFIKGLVTYIQTFEEQNFVLFEKVILNVIETSMMYIRAEHEEAYQKILEQFFDVSESLGHNFKILARIGTGGYVDGYFEKYRINITNPNTDSTIKTQVDLEFPANTFATPEFNKYAIEINNNTGYTELIAVNANLPIQEINIIPKEVSQLLLKSFIDADDKYRSNFELLFKTEFADTETNSNLTLPVDMQQSAYKNLGVFVNSDNVGIAHSLQFGVIVFPKESTMIDIDVLTEWTLDRMTDQPFFKNSFHAIELPWADGVEFIQATFKSQNQNVELEHRYVVKYHRKFVILYVPSNINTLDIDIEGYDNINHKYIKYVDHRIISVVGNSPARLNIDTAFSNFNFETRFESDGIKSGASQEYDLALKYVHPNETYKYYFDVDGIEKEPVKAYIIIKKGLKSFTLDLPIYFEKNRREEKFYTKFRVSDEFEFASIYLLYINNESGKKRLFKDTFKIGRTYFIKETAAPLNLYIPVNVRTNDEIIRSNIYEKINYEENSSLNLAVAHNEYQHVEKIIISSVNIPELSFKNLIYSIKSDAAIRKNIRYAAHLMYKNGRFKIINAYSRQNFLMSVAAYIRYYPITNNLVDNKIKLTITTKYDEYEINDTFKIDAINNDKHYNFEVWDDVIRVKIEYKILGTDPMNGSVIEQNIVEIYTVGELWGGTETKKKLLIILAKKDDKETIRNNIHLYNRQQNANQQLIKTYFENVVPTYYILPSLVKKIDMNCVSDIVGAYKMSSLDNVVVYNIPDLTAIEQLNLRVAFKEHIIENTVLEIKVDCIKHNTVTALNFNSLNETVKLNTNIFIRSSKTKILRATNFIYGVQRRVKLYATNYTFTERERKIVPVRKIVNASNFANTTASAGVVKWDPVELAKEKYPVLANKSFNRVSILTAKNAIDSFSINRIARLYGTMIISYSGFDQNIQIYNDRYKLLSGLKLVFPFIVEADQIKGPIYDVLDRINNSKVVINKDGYIRIIYGIFEYEFKDKRSQEQLDYAIKQKKPLPEEYWSNLDDYGNI
jgi:hypothetical protein